MITSLRIENFALIDRTEINFKQGFTVITGETGSGKSILLNALNLILGERANFSVIGNRKDKSIVEAEILVKGFQLEHYFEENELDFFETCIVRREISKQGRSRAFINDTPVQLSVLKGLTSKLVHIHSQYNTLELKQSSYQMRMLDALAGTLESSEDFQKNYQQLLIKRRDLEKAREELHEASSSQDYNSFQLEELLALRLDDVDYDQLGEKLRSAEDSEGLNQLREEIDHTINGDEGIADKLRTLKSSLDRFEHHDSVKEVLDRINSSLLELSDIAGSSDSIGGEDGDPEKIQEWTSQLDEFNRVAFKHRVDSSQALKAVRDSLQRDNSDHSELELRVNRLQQDVERIEKELMVSAEKLHENRVNASDAIAKNIETNLVELKLENTQVQFKLDKTDELSVHGLTKLELLFSPNAGVAPVPIHQAASGGELSRVMLALQSMLSEKIQLRSVLFDEIDTGVSGDVAQKVGQTLKNMGGAMQVIAITHLPQVAARGSQHLLVSKSVEDDQTISKVVELSDEERVEETARLMSGDTINQAALDNARALMQ